MKTEQFITCNGTIQQNGFCNSCGQPAQTTGFSCGRLIPLEPADSYLKTAEEIAEEIMQAGQFGGSLQACTELIKAYAEQAIDRCANVMIDDWKKHEKILDVKNELK